MLMRADPVLAQPRAIGEARLSTKAAGNATRIDTLRHAGAMKLLFPRATTPLQAIIVNTAGGITGGDQFRIDAKAGENSALSLTTQAAERAYRAQPGQTGRMITKLCAEEGSTLHWLPQETILFEGAALDRRLNVELAPTARFLMVEPLLFGRQAMGEEPRNLRFDDRIEVRRTGKPIYRDGMRWSGDVAVQLDRPAVAGGARAIVSLLYVAPDATGHLDPMRDMLGDLGGASLLAPDILTMRLCAPDGFTLRRHLLPVLDRLTRHSLPLSWRL